MTTSTDRTRSFADVIGIAGSTLCALHCLVVPLSLVIAPLGQLPNIDDEQFHRVMLWVLVPAATLAFVVGCARHRDRLVMICGAVGLVSLVLAFTMFHEWLGESGERVAATFAAGVLITGHVRNFRLCRAGDCDHEGAQAT